VVAEGVDAVEVKVAVMEVSLDAERGQQGRVELTRFLDVANKRNYFLESRLFSFLRRFSLSPSRTSRQGCVGVTSFTR
jgi:hypothetical protein